MSHSLFVPLRRAAKLCVVAASLVSASALTACSNEGPLAPQAPAASSAVAPKSGAVQTGFVMGWGVTGDTNGTTTTTVTTTTLQTSAGDTTATAPRRRK